MDEYREFYTLHLPHLISYVVPVLQSKRGNVEIGSGVLVNANGRHFIATAKHCIDADVRVVRSTNPLQRACTTSARPLHIVKRGWHDTLDLGYLLEIADPGCAEVGWDQLCKDRVVSGMAQFVGYPEVLVEAIQTVPGKLTDVSLAAGTFGTTLKEETDDRMTFDYPKIGAKYEEARERGTKGLSRKPRGDSAVVRASAWRNRPASSRRYNTSCWRSNTPGTNVTASSRCRSSGGASC